MDSFLRKRVDEGMRRRYLPKNDSALYEKAKRQAERELRLIEKLGSGWVLPDRVGRCAVLQGQRHSDSRAWLGSE